jgi:hypothetical protein
MPNETNKLTDRQLYRNVERARRAIINQMARQLHFAQSDLEAVADVIAERDAAQRKYREVTGEVAHKTLNQLS